MGQSKLEDNRPKPLVDKKLLLKHNFAISEYEL